MSRSHINQHILRPLGILALAGLSFLAAQGTGIRLFFHLFYLLLALQALSYLWAWTNLRGLQVQRETYTHRTQVGEQARERITIRNLWPIPKLWVELQDHSTMPQHGSGFVTYLPGRERRRWFARTPCTMRGKFTLGPATLISGDPFGIFRLERTVAGTSEVLVYPQTTALPGFRLPSAELPGGQDVKSRTLPEQPARRDLPVRELRIAESTEEYGVLAAASIARHLLEQNRSVGLISWGQHREVLPAERESRQLFKMLEALAVLRAHGAQPLAEVLAAESVRFGRNCTLVIITASLDERWVVSLQHLLYRGVRAVVILVDPQSFGGWRDSLTIQARLAELRVPTYLFRQGQPLADALQQASIVGPTAKTPRTPRS